MFVPRIRVKCVAVSKTMIRSRYSAKSSPGLFTSRNHHAPSVTGPATKMDTAARCSQPISFIRPDGRAERHRGHFFAVALIVSAQNGQTFVSTVSFTHASRSPRPSNKEINQRAQEMQENDDQHPNNLLGAA